MASMVASVPDLAIVPKWYKLSRRATAVPADGASLAETEYAEENPTPNCPITKSSPPTAKATGVTAVPDLAIEPKWFTKAFSVAPSLR